MKELINASKEVDVNNKDEEGRTLLTLAMRNINLETAEFVNMIINSKGGDVNTQDAKGQSPLYHLTSGIINKKLDLYDDNNKIELKVA